MINNYQLFLIKMISVKWLWFDWKQIFGKLFCFVFIVFKIIFHLNFKLQIFIEKLLHTFQLSSLYVIPTNYIPTNSI